LVVVGQQITWRLSAGDKD